jgi:dihydrodipicolinate synthase/N-acetylneuraminate lyase
MKPFAGIYTPIATPFRDDGTVDERALAANVSRWMTTPLTGLVVLGSNGEAPLSRSRSRSRGGNRPGGVPRRGR